MGAATICNTTIQGDAMLMILYNLWDTLPPWYHKIKFGIAKHRCVPFDFCTYGDLLLQVRVGVNLC